MKHRTTLTRPFLAAALALGVGLAPAPASTATTTDGSAPTRAATATDEPGKLLLMLDASGSMKEKDGSGTTKITAAKKALTSVVDSLPDDTNVGLRVYGATQPGGTPTKAACADTQLVAPIAPLDKPNLKAAITGFDAKGETPIAHSLTQGLKDLGDTGPRSIILVSDGEESCVPDPCPVVKKLVKNGIDLRIDTVGFDVDTTARKQLQCLADAGNGTYYDAEDADQLTTSLNKLSQQALRQFTVHGTPITLTEDIADAPKMSPGRYTDTFSAGDPARYARITRIPNSVVHVAFIVRPPSGGHVLDTEDWELSLSTPDGEECDTEREAGSEFFRSGSSLTMAVAANTGVTDPDADDPCATSEELVLEVTHDEGKGTDLPVQLVHLEEPPVTDVTSLPEALDVETIKPSTAKGGGSPQPIVGGGGFADAPELTPGSYEETLLPGEQVYYKVRLDFGQRAAFTAKAGPLKEFGFVEYSHITVNSWNPALEKTTRVWTQAGPENRGSLSKDTPSAVLGEFVPEVRYRNKESRPGFRSPYDALPETSMPGYYYFAIGREHADDSDVGAPLPVRIDVDVDGTATGAPQYAGASSPSASADQSDSPTRSSDTTTAPARNEGEGRSPLPWIGGGILLAVLLGAGAWLGLRRRA